MKTYSFTLLLAFLVIAAFGQPGTRTPITPGVREYDFQNTLTEKKGNSPALVPLDTLGTYLLDTLNEINNRTRIVYRFRKGAGLQFNNTQAGNFVGQTYSIEMYFVFDELASWKRVIDWKNRTTDKGAYIWNGQLNFYNYVSSDSAYVSPGEYTYYVLTRDSATMNVTIFTDTKKGISFTDTYMDAVMDTNNVLNFFQDDLMVQNEASAGAVSMVNIYNYVLDSATIVQHFNNLQGQIFSVGNKNKAALKVYPNPAKDNLVIDLSRLGGQDEVRVSLLDLTGRVVFSNVYNKGQKVDLDLNSLNFSRGIYLIKAESGSDIYTQKIVIGK
jgi:OmpA-OmpF porin, OOP family